MKSPFTGKEMQLIREKRILNFRKEDFEYVHHAYRCNDTGEEFTTTELDELNIFQVYNQYREKHSIPFPEEIKKIREKYEVSAAKMSNILGLGINSYRQYEDGEVPLLSNARLIQSASSPAAFKSMVDVCDELSEKERNKLLSKLNTLMQEEHSIFPNKIITKALIGDTKPACTTGYMIPDLSKLTEMVVYYSESLKPYKTKLNKLLFYADFYHFKKTGASISGCRYRAIDMGPVINNFQSIFERMEQEKIEIKTQIFEGDKTGEQFVVKGDMQFEQALFSASEIESLEKVIQTFGKTKTDEIIQKSHEETAWIESFKTKSLISFNYAFELKHI